MLQREEIRERKKVSIGGLTILTLFVIVLVIAGIVSIMRSVGKSHLTTAVAGTGDELITIGEPIPEDAPQELQLEEGQILYENGIYELNKDLITILIMGIDKETVTEIGGQSWTEEEDPLMEYIRICTITMCILKNLFQIRLEYRLRDPIVK